MKKLILFLAFFGAFALTSNAQTCSKKTASASKSCCAKTTAANSAAAAKLASADASIEAKTCSKSGTVSYYKNTTCSVSGKTTTAQVTYDAATAKFVNVSPMEAENASGGKNVKAVKATKTVKAKAKKSCCSKSSAKSCSKSAKVEN